jgi:S-adenosylmethionine:tRNA ribosyltransferase-isomerase
VSATALVSAAARNPVHSRNGAPLEPAEARRPPEARGRGRDDVRLLVASRSALVHTRFAALPELLEPGDLIVVNTSRTLPASVPARRRDGTALTVNLSTPVPFEDGGRWLVELRRDGERFREGRGGELLSLPGGASAELLLSYMGTRLWVAELTLPEPLLEYLDHHGCVITYGHVEGDWPLGAHQTVYAGEPGSAEMPSAGRPFTTELIARLVARGIDVAPLVLHTGVSSLERNETPLPERYRVPETTAERVNLTRHLGGRVIAVGTTVVRALESAVSDDGHLTAAAGWTDLVIEPRRGVQAIDAILTGFHDWDSSHLQMLEAIAGPELIERTYSTATAAGYLRHEFGDLALIEGGEQ